MAGIWIGVGKSEAVASGQRFSAHYDGRWARHGTHQWIILASSDSPTVSATALCLSLNASGFQTFPLSVSPDGLYLCIRTILHVRSCRNIYMEAVEQQLLMGRMRARVLVALRARFSRNCSCSERWSVPFILSRCMCRAARTRAICVKASMQCLLYIA